MTPLSLARRIVSGIALPNTGIILEPSCGDGRFLVALADQVGGKQPSVSQDAPLRLMGIEIDPLLAATARARLARWRRRTASGMNVGVYEADFFDGYLRGFESGNDGRVRLAPNSIDLIVGNPPFGGTFDHAIEDILDGRLGNRLGRKIKKETYAFFIVACMELLRPGGRLVFICSNTLLTIPTMTGLRHLLMEHGEVDVTDLDRFSDETTYPMVVLNVVKRKVQRCVRRNGVVIANKAIKATANLSWGITQDLAKVFRGPCLGDCFVASSGMTTGKNEYFVPEDRRAWTNRGAVSIRVR